MPVHIVMVETSHAHLQQALDIVAQSLLPKKYYAHFVDQNRMYVVFPSTIIVVRRSNGGDELICSAVARLFSVPDSQLPYRKMFEFKHSEDDQN